MKRRTLLFGALLFGSSGAAIVAFAQVPMGDRSGAHSVELAPVAAQGPPQETTDLLTTGHLKLTRIVVRKKTPLATHVHDRAAVVQALSGRGLVEAGGKKMPLDARHLVVLAPNVAHSVTPESEMLELLVVGIEPGPMRGHGPRM